ncbi:MAG: Rpn family recombination-promoting nuclease/putative transposase [Pseudomonadota bacterium]
MEQLATEQLQDQPQDKPKMYGTNRYLNPTNDVSFKKLFSTEDHKDLLISFLNTMLGLEGKSRITQVEFLPQELPALWADGKRSILDVQCTDASGIRYIVEMQNQNVPDFAKRTQMYAAHSYVAQLGPGSNHFQLSPIVLLAIANYPLFPTKKHYISYHKMLDVKTYENDLQDISYVFVDLSKFNKEDPAKLETTIDKWLYFLKYWEDAKSPPEVITEPELLEAYATMERFNWNSAELDYYLKSQIALSEQCAIQKQKLEEGIQKGRKEERTKAELEKNKIRQEEQKKAELEKNKIRQEEQKKAELEKVRIVRQLLQQGIDTKIISHVTGMDEAFITEMLRKVG